jgi:hypothetical protein
MDFTRHDTALVLTDPQNGRRLPGIEVVGQ